MIKKVLILFILVLVGLSLSVGISAQQSPPEEDPGSSSEEEYEVEKDIESIRRLAEKIKHLAESIESLVEKNKVELGIIFTEEFKDHAKVIQGLAGWIAGQLVTWGGEELPIPPNGYKAQPPEEDSENSDDLLLDDTVPKREDTH